MGIPANNDCEGQSPFCTPGQVRKLPAGGGSNMIICYRCYIKEKIARKDFNKGLLPKDQIELPAWTDLEVYTGE